MVKTKEVAKLSAEARFLYWIKERHSIYLKRKAGKPKPWTNDEVLQSYFFTNPYRENDKTTVWLRGTVREPLRNDPKVLMAIIIFRWFNYIPTGEYLHSHRYLYDWNRAIVNRQLSAARSRGEKVFTGAYMINSPGGEPKLQAICRRISNVWRKRKSLLGRAEHWTSLQQAHEDLIRFEGLGGFMAYEIVCDLRYAYLLGGASDKHTWCSPGPGCIRGLYRVAEEEIKNKSNATSPSKPEDWQERMEHLLVVCSTKLKGMPAFEMREVEHSLCEFDKYERARLGDGKLKRKFKGAR